MIEYVARVVFSFKQDRVEEKKLSVFISAFGSFAKAKQEVSRGYADHSFCLLAGSLNSINKLPF